MIERKKNPLVAVQVFLVLTQPLSSMPRPLMEKGR